MKPSWGLWLILGCGLFPTEVFAWNFGRWQLDLRLHIATSYDSNVRRIAVSKPPLTTQMLRWFALHPDGAVTTRLPPTAIEADGVHKLGLQAALRYRDSKHLWTFRYGLGLQHVFLANDEDSLVQRAETSYYYRIHRRILLGAEIQANDARRQNQSRESSLLFGQGHLLWLAPQGWQLHLRGGYSGFQYRHFESYPDTFLDGYSDGERFSYHGDQYHLWVTKRFSPVWRLSFGYSFSRLFYKLRLVVIQDQTQGLLRLQTTAEPRGDLFHSVGVQLRFLYLVLVDLSYRLEILQSDSYGEPFLGHRIQALFATPLFWKMTLAIQGQLLFRSYINGLTINQIIQQTETDANLTALTIRVRRPVYGALSMQLRYSLFTNQFSAGLASYLRHLALVQFTVRY